MKKHLSIFIVALFAALSAQAQPNWLKTQDREQNYPSSTFFYGFQTGNMRNGETQATAQARLLKDAQAELTEKILVRVRSKKNLDTERTKTQGENGEKEIIKDTFISKIITETDLELTNVKTDSYSENGLLYAFAYVNKYELIGYYSASLNMNLQQLESMLATAQQLEQSGEKSKARAQYETAEALHAKVELAQNVLVALDANAATHIEKTTVHYNTIEQALARLKQGVYVFVESSEDMFGKTSTLISNKVKSELSKKGCSFTNDITQADYVVKLKASARKHGTPGDIVFCYADVEVALVKTQSGKTLYQEELSQKGGHTTYENAAREAFNAIGNTIAVNLTEKLTE
ncbi:MAG: hypothetical protein FWC39_11250 [Bacteroidetes bacterium]|nr:hypothetical protein [Bacteroidota bacterium]